MVWRFYILRMLPLVCRRPVRRLIFPCPIMRSPMILCFLATPPGPTESFAKWIADRPLRFTCKGLLLSKVGLETFTSLFPIVRLLTLHCYFVHAGGSLRCLSQCLPYSRFTEWFFLHLGLSPRVTKSGVVQHWSIALCAYNQKKG